MRQLSGRPITGIKAVEGSSRRRIDKEKEVEIIDYFTEKGITVWEPKIMGIGKIEAKLKKIGENKNLIDKFCTKSKPPIILVAENDPRTAVKDALDYLDDEIEENN